MKSVSCCKYSFCRVGGLLLLVALSGFSIGITAHMHMTSPEHASLVAPEGRMTWTPVRGVLELAAAVEDGISRT